jgi:aldose 1-epimerase
MLLHSAIMRRVFRTQILSFSALVLFLALPNAGGDYSVFTHEAIIDAVWGTHLQQLLQKRFSDAIPDELRQVHAHAYGGAIIQDAGYHPYGSKFFSELTHFVRSGDFFGALPRDAQDVNEYSFVVGSMSRYAEDNDDHRPTVNRATVETSRFGTLDDGTPIEMLTLRNAKGVTAKVITYGATLTELWVPDRSGKLADVVLGFDQLPGYLGKHPWFGATVGRVANRIAKGKFTLDGKQYSLEINNPPNNLHSGSKGLSRTVWKAETLHEAHAATVRLTAVSPDGDGGFPGKLSVTLVYRLTDDNNLELDYTARTDKATPVNLTNHSYFNLSGGKDILDEILYLPAERYTPVDATQIPTGEVQAVKGTPLDFTHPVAIGARIGEMKGNPGGYDHNYVLSMEAGKLKLAARVLDPASGRQMEVWTTEPGMQFYSGNSLDGTITGKRGVVYGKHSGFCLETQHFPDSVNHSEFPSVILRPGGVYRTETTYKFSAK